MSRNRKLFLNMILSVGIKGMGIFITLALMPAYMTFFHDQRILGFWFTLLSILNWILTFDFGIGNGLRNTFTSAIASNNISDGKKIISTTYWLSVQFALFSFIICFFILYLIDWHSIFNISTDVINEKTLNKAVLIVLISIVLQFVLKIITSILLAIQMPSISHLTGLISNILIFISVLLFHSTSDEINLVTLSYVYLIASNVPLVFLTIIIFKTSLKEFTPCIKNIDKEIGFTILKLGGGFFILQILSLILFNIKEVLIAVTLDPIYVVEFQIYNRIFGLINSLAWIALIPIWSAITEAYIKRDYSWMRLIYYRLRKLMLPITLAVLLLIASMEFIVELWLKDNSIKIQLSYSIAFGTSCLLYIWWGIVASFANGMGKIKTQLFLSVIGVILNISLAVIFVGLFQSWIGVIYANIISMLPYCIVEPINIKRVITRGHYESYK